MQFSVEIFHCYAWLLQAIISSEMNKNRMLLILEVDGNIISQTVGENMRFRQYLSPGTHIAKFWVEKFVGPEKNHSASRHTVAETRVTFTVLDEDDILREDSAAIEAESMCVNDFWVSNLTGRILRDVSTLTIHNRSVLYYKPAHDGKPWAARDEAIQRFREAGEAAARGDRVAAIALYKWAIALDRSMWEAHINIAIEYAALGRHHLAKIYALGAWAVDPDNGVARHSLGRTLKGLWQHMRDAARGATALLSALRGQHGEEISDAAGLLSAGQALIERAETETLPEVAAQDLDEAQRVYEMLGALNGGGDADAWCGVAEAKDLRSNVPSKLCVAAGGSGCDERADFVLKREAVGDFVRCIERDVRRRYAYMRVDQILTGAAGRGTEGFRWVLAAAFPKQRECRIRAGWWGCLT